MNQNTIREAINMIRLSRVCSGNHLVSCGFCCENMETTENNLRDLANRLEAAPPFEQPPVEQSEPTHPLHAGYVILDGEKRELRRSMRVNICPFCDTNFFNGEHNPDKCKASYVPAPIYQFLAPPAVIEPEPELDEFEQWAQRKMNDDSFTLHYRDAVEAALEKYRESITRKGDK